MVFKIVPVRYFLFTLTQIEGGPDTAGGQYISLVLHFLPQMISGDLNVLQIQNNLQNYSPVCFNSYSDLNSIFFTANFRDFHIFAQIFSNRIMNAQDFSCHISNVLS